MRIKELAKKSKTIVTIYEKVMDVVYPLSTMISPTLNTKLRYKSAFGKPLDLNNPQTLNEKNQWLKSNTYYKNPLVKECADKYKVRDYITRIGCKETLNELIAVYENADDIEWDKLPSSYVIKLNSGCGFNIVVPDSKKLDRIEVVEKLKKRIKIKYYLDYSEMQYKDVKPYILIEKYLKPKRIDEAFVYADKLSKPFPFVRTDLYLFDDSIYFGELTFTSAGGLDKDITPEGLNHMGEMIDLNYRGNEK